MHNIYIFQRHRRPIVLNLNIAMIVLIHRTHRPVKVVAEYLFTKNKLPFNGISPVDFYVAATPFRFHSIVRIRSREFIFIL